MTDRDNEILTQKITQIYSKYVPDNEPGHTGFFSECDIQYWLDTHPRTFENQS